GFDTKEDAVVGRVIWAAMAAICLVGGVAWADRTIVVAHDGSGDYTSVQAAVDAVPENNSERVIIESRPGTHRERITVPKNKPMITFRGQDPETTILTWNWNAKTIGPGGKEVGTSGSYSTQVNAPDFIAENITFENTAGETGQALALSATGD